MSVDMSAAPETEIGSLPDPTTEYREAPRPAAHGSAVQAVFNDLDDDVDLGLANLGESSTTYDAMHSLWKSFGSDASDEPFVVAQFDEDRLEWLDNARDDRDWALVLTSSGWMAGTGQGDDWSSFFEYHLKLREIDDDGELYKPPLALHIQVTPQYRHLQYEDGNNLECPHGEGSRVVCWTTWAESSSEIESRMIDGLELALGLDRRSLRDSREYDSRKIIKAEAHHRVDIGWKRQVIEAIEQSKSLIAFGGSSEIEAHQTRQKEGYLEAVVNADRWHLLGFEHTPYDIELKLYQASGWTEIPRDEPAHHPKLEASFAGVNQGALPHVDEWEETLQVLREIVSTHLEWADVDRENLVADDYQDGPASPAYKYAHPLGRKDQLRERYEAIGTEIYREAMKSNTDAVYDILRVISVESGASYDMLEERTGLARSTIRYHVRRMQDAGVVTRVGNPVLVVFPSIEVLDRASEILRKIFPGDEPSEMAERAEERRERREQRDDPDADDVDQEDSVDDDRDSSSNEWDYFSNLDLEPLELADALIDDDLDDDHVRVRTDPYRWVD